MTEGEILRLGMGLVVVGLIYAGVRRSRDWSDKPTLMAELVDTRLHYALAGLVLSLSAPVAMRKPLGEGADLANVYLAGIWGLTVGCSFDLRLLRRFTRPLLWLEIGHLILLAIVVWILTYGFFQVVVEEGADAGRGAVMWTVCGLGAASWMRRRSGGRGKGKGKNVGWFPSVSAMAGILLAGIGLMQLRSGSFPVRQPLAFPQVIVVEGVWEGVLWCLVLGALVGLIVDLATREVRRGHLYFLLAAGLLLGCGMALVLGLEPLWVGTVAGIWLINATLRRLDLLRALEQGQGLVRTVLPGVAGWTLGTALLAGGFDLAFAGWILLILIVGVPAVRLGVWHGVGKLLERSALRRTGVEPRQLLELDDLALIVALGLVAVLPAAQGAALLAAALVGQRLMHLVAVLAGDKLTRLTGARVGPQAT